MLKLLSLLAFLAAGFLIWQRYQPLSFSSVPAEQSAQPARTPQLLSIPDLDLNLPVFPGEIKNNRWPVTPKGVIFLATSPVSNTIIYGHNWLNLLGYLKNIRLGQKINLLYSDSLTKTFVVDEIKVVSPNDASILESSDHQLLTIYTCIGFLDTKRLVVVAKPQSN